MRTHKHPTITRSLGSGELTVFERMTLVAAVAWIIVNIITVIR